VKSRAGNNLTRSIVIDLGMAIVRGDYELKHFPTEAQLADQYAASRNIVREAVKILGEKGLLRSSPRKGTSVRPENEWNILDSDILEWFLERELSLPLLLEFTQVRMQIEPAAAALAAASASVDQIAAIETAMARIEASENGDGDPLEADISFHISLLEASGNRFFVQLSSLTETALRFSIRFTNKYKSKRTHLTAHREIFLAIKNGDAKKARQEAQDLLSTVESIIIERLANEQVNLQGA